MTCRKENTGPRISTVEGVLTVARCNALQLNDLAAMDRKVSAGRAQVEVSIASRQNGDKEREKGFLSLSEMSVWTNLGSRHESSIRIKMKFNTSQ